MPVLTSGVNITLSVDGTNLIVSSSTMDINAQVGTTYTIVLGDAGHLVTLTNAATVTATIPTNAAVAFPVGTVVGFAQMGAGSVVIEGDTGVVVNGTSAGSESIAAQYGTATATKLDTNTWLVSGSLT